MMIVYDCSEVPTSLRTNKEENMAANISCVIWSLRRPRYSLQSLCISIFGNGICLEGHIIMWKNALLYVENY